MIRAALTIRALKADSGNTPVFGASEDSADRRKHHSVLKTAQLLAKAKRAVWSAWPFASLCAGLQPNRFRSDADIGFGGARDLIATEAN
jgi:hypothetical protein